MSLFQKSVEQKYLKQLDAKLIETKYIEFKSHFANPEIQENIRNSKEEQYQGEFLIDLFVNILGYTKNPSANFNLTTEYKNIKDSKKADGAIVINGVVKAVIELKGTDTTDLSKVESQAFGYKNNQTDCVYIVTSNFEKLRFYIDNAIEHIEFNLFILSKQDFEILYLCLAYESIAKGTPKKIKDESLSHEEKITKELYRDYSLFKNELYQNLVTLNPQVDTLTLYKKSQKLLDRFLFLFFAEDRYLLPPNSVRLVLNDWKELIERDEVKPLYDRFKKYFEYLNTGYKGKRYDVFAYNGGLFKPDEILDKVNIDDDLLYKHTLKLSEYDFVSEVDVNILGHIFENSLNELDEIKAQQEGQEVDKSKTKRKKDGVFYTPKYITKYIVENTVGKLCLEKKAELQINEEDYITDKKRQIKTKQALLEKLNIYSNWLLQLTICDPACGSGAFLNQALDFLISEHHYIDELKAKLYGVPMILSDIEKSILENNLFGVDLNEESVEIAKLSLWLRTAQPNRKLNDLNNNIKCGNSLIDDPTIAGDKAFNWHKEFPHVFAKGGFNVVIGNPPYVQIRTQSILSKDLEKIGFETYEKMSDLYCLFYEQGIKIIKKGGYLGYITSNKWLRARYGKPLRTFILNNSNPKLLIDLGSDVFESATVDSNILILQKETKQSLNLLALDLTKEKKINSFDFFIDKYYNINDLTSDIWTISDTAQMELKTKIEQVGVALKNWNINFYRGVQTGNNDVFIIDNKCKEELIKNNPNSINLIKPIVQGRDISRYFLNYNQKYLLYIDDNTNLDLYPSIYQYLQSYKSSLENKIEVQQGKMEWFSLYRPATNHINEFEKVKMIFSKASKEQSFLIDYYLGAYTLNTSYICTGENIEYLVLVLNSRLAKYIFLNFYQSGGIDGEVTIQAIENLPVPICAVEKFNFYSALSKDIHSKYANQNNKINQFLGLLNDNLNIDYTTKSLVNFYELDFKGFLAELIKLKINIPLTEQVGWKEVFEKYKSDITLIKKEIFDLETQIDQMVYKLYNLTEEEIKIIENS